MKYLINKLAPLLIGFILGVICIALFSFYNVFESMSTMQNNQTSASNEVKQEMSTEDKPLYWVAPMDPSFQRDEPGLSPMGMDLVPFYGADNNDTEEGVVLINPAVSNNISVKIEHVKFTPWQGKIESYGVFEYNEEKIHHLHSRVSGWINELYVNAQGDKIKKGQALYSFYSPELANAQEELLLSLNTNEKQLIHAAQEKLASLGVPFQAIKSVIDTRKVQKNITYYAQLDGVVKKLMVRHGFYVKPESNIMSIAPLDSIWLQAEVFESQLNQIQENDPVTVKTDAYPNIRIMGTVDYIYPSLQLPSRTAKIRIRINNTKLNLKPNMFAQVLFTKTDNKNTIIVPLNSVIRTGKSDRVVLVKDTNEGTTKYQSIAVTLGRSNSEYIEVISGLEEGDCVVSSAQFLIDSESSVGRELDRMGSKDSMNPSPSSNGGNNDESDNKNNRHITINTNSLKPMKNQIKTSMAPHHSSNQH